MGTINDKKANYKKLRILILLTILIILIAFIYMTYQGKSEPGKLMLLLVFLFYSLLTRAVITFIKIHNQNIKEEIDRWIIPDKNKTTWWKIFNKIIIPEYNIHNQVPPIIAWFLYDFQIWKEDIVCIIYKWIWLWVILISYTEWWIIITKIWNISKKDTPPYEYNFWNLLFKNWSTVQFPNKYISNDLDFIRKWVEKYCLEKGWIYYKNIYSIFSKRWKIFNNNQFIPFWRILWVFLAVIMLIICIFFASRFQYIETAEPRMVIAAIWIGLAIPICEIIMFYFIMSMKETYNKHTIKLTKEWEEIVRNIHWYKKFLELCEEKQLKELIKQDSLYIDKTLQYAVALGLENNISNKIPKKLADNKIKDIFLLERII